MGLWATRNRRYRIERTDMAKPTQMHLLGAALLCALTVTGCRKQQGKPTGVETGLSALSFENGYPTAETTRKLFDEMDHQRAVQAYLWAYPAVSFESILVAAQGFGLDYNDLGIAD